MSDPTGSDKPGAQLAGAGAHILLFEDDDTLAGLLARVLRTDGYHVDVHESANAMPPAATAFIAPSMSAYAVIRMTGVVGTASCTRRSTS